MMIGLFGYPGDQIERTQAVCALLKKRGAEKLVCLGGLVFGGRREDVQGEPGSVLRWLRREDIPTLANDTDRQVAGWRLQALVNTTGYIQPRVRNFLAAISREEAQWIYARPTALPIGRVLCCADCLTMDALYPVPLARFNATKLFDVMEQKAAFFPSANGPTMLVRRQSDGVLEAARYENVEEQLDSPKVAGIIGGILGFPPLNGDVSWGALVDEQATCVSLICLDARTLKPIPERAALMVSRADSRWKA